MSTPTPRGGPARLQDLPTPALQAALRRDDVPAPESAEVEAEYVRRVRAELTRAAGRAVGGPAGPPGRSSGGPPPEPEPPAPITTAPPPPFPRRPGACAPGWYVDGVDPRFLRWWASDGPTPYVQPVPDGPVRVLPPPG